jgi:hypothetical protein
MTFLGGFLLFAGTGLGRPSSDGNYGTLVPLSAWVFNRAFVSMSYLPIAMFRQVR